MPSPLRLYSTAILAAAIAFCFIQTTQAQINRQRQSQTLPQRIPTATEIAKRTFPSVVLLITENSDGQPVAQGSGFFVQADVIVTNYHVIKGASRIKAKIVGQKGVYNISEVLGRDKEADLAILRVEGIRGRPLSFGDSSRVAVGEVVYAVGNPEGLEGTFSQGIVSSLRGRSYIQITAPISHGSSGGPVLNKRGEVIGVAIGAIEEGQNLNFAVPVSYLADLISSNKAERAAAPGDVANGIPSSAKAYYDTGKTYYKQGRYAEAIEAYQQALRLAPNYDDALFEMGVAYSLLGRHQEAINAFKQVIRLIPDDAHAYYQLGLVYSDLGRRQEAIEAYRQAIRIKPDDATAGMYCSLGLSYAALGRRQEAIEAYKQAIQIEPDHAEAHYFLGCSYSLLGRDQEAIEAYKQAIRIKPDHAEAHCLLGGSYAVLGNKRAALEEYEILKSLDKKLANDLFEFIYIQRR
jgi:tetratricopeptide (TPR) repeat protein